MAACYSVVIRGFWGKGAEWRLLRLVQGGGCGIMWE